MGKPYVASREFPDWAGDRACGTEARAIQVAKQIGIKRFNSFNDSKAVNKKCKEQNKANEPKPEPEKKKDKEKPITEGPVFVGKNPETGEGMTQWEADLYRDELMFGLGAAQQSQIQDSINATSLAIQNLANEAQAYSDDSATARNTYSEDAASWRTDISTQRQKDWQMYDSAMDYKAAVDSEKIRGEYGLSIQKLMTAGSQEVAKIQGEYSTANTRLQGEYGLQGEKIRANASRDVAQRNKEATIFGSFLNGFWS